MTDLGGLLARVVAALDRVAVPFMIAGSFASTAHGLPRATQDLDVVIDPPNLAALDALIREFPADAYYLDPDTAHQAFRMRSMFNVIDLATGWKLDFIVRKERAFSVEELARRVPIALLGVAVFIATAEDTIVAKLEWSRMGGGSERQRRDVAGIVLAMGDRLDRAYVEGWARAMGLEDEWALAQAIAL